jgi:hypothetical protein
MLEKIKAYLPKKKKNYTILLILLIPLFFIIILISKPRETPVPDAQITEPQAPISTEVLGIDITKRDTPTTIVPPKTTANTGSNTQTNGNTNGTNNEGNNNPGENSGGNNNPGDNNNATPAPINTINIPDNSYLTLGNISSIRVSPDGKKFLVLYRKATAQSFNLINVLFPVAKAQDSNLNQDLAILDNNGLIIKQFDFEVSDAAFIDNSNIYFQKLGTGAGIYQYDLTNDKQANILYSYDTKTFSNTEILDANTILYIKPALGEVGIANKDFTNTQVIETKLLDTNSNYVKKSAFNYLSVSPDKKYFGYYDLNATENLKVTAKIYKADARSADQVYMKVEVANAVGGFRTLDDAFQWSQDGTKVVVGDDSTVVDLVSKTFETHDQNTTSIISPDGENIIIVNAAQQIASYKNISTNQITNISESQSDIQWLSNNLIILVIGQKLYIYNISTNSLSTVFNDRADYRIAKVDSVNGRAWVTANSKIFEISKK